MTDLPAVTRQAQHSEDPKTATRLDGSSPSARSGLPQGETEGLSALTRQALEELVADELKSIELAIETAPPADDLQKISVYLMSLADAAYRQGAREAQPIKNLEEGLAYVPGELLRAELEKRQIRPEGERLLLNAYGRECYEHGKAEGAREVIARCAQIAKEPWGFRIPVTDQDLEEWGPDYAPVVDVDSSAAETADAIWATLLDSSPDYTLAGSLAPTREGHEPQLPTVTQAEEKS